MPVEPTVSLGLRTATAADAEAIAALHARSWRSAYRGMMTDAYLDGPIDSERLTFWRARYAAPPVGLWAAVATQPDEDRLAGFVCLIADYDPEWGTLIDNLHADPEHKGRGVGRLLMRAAAEHLGQALPDRPVHLTVLAANAPAEAFYQRIGGRAAGSMVKQEPDGSHLSIIRYVWDSPAALAEATR